MKKPNCKLRKPDSSSSKLILGEIIGLTTTNCNGLASSISKPYCAYLAGCVVVLYNVESGTQSHLVVSSRKLKSLSCVAVSQDGSLVAAGESGHQPAVLLWDCASRDLVSELKGHQYGVACTAFSPDGRHLASVGFPNDGYICLWDWRSQILISKIKACSSSSAVASVCFSADARAIVTAGRKHLKFWSVGSSNRFHANAKAGLTIMHGKPIILGFRKESSFIAVTSPIWTNGDLSDCCQPSESLPTYALTDTGLLCLLNSRFSVRTTVDLKVDKAFALSASNKWVACACNDGLVKIFNLDSLEFAGSLQHMLDKRSSVADEADGLENVGKYEFRSSCGVPDAIACRFSTFNKLVVIYEDHSLYIWDVQNVDKATRCCVLVSHRSCIWDVNNLPCENMHDPSIACVARGCSGGVSFATCSIDGAIRLWDLILQPVTLENCANLATENNLATRTVENTLLVTAGIFERDSVASVTTQGFRAMAVSSDGKYLAAGDCRGNLHIYDLHASNYMCIEAAHAAEILSLSFSVPDKKDQCSDKVSEGYYLLASGGRDRMIHIYNVDRNFDLVGSVDDHSAAVTSVKLACNGRKILSSSADRSLVFRDVVAVEGNYKISRCHHQMASHGTIYDMAVDTVMGVAVTVGQDKKLNTFNVADGKLIRSFKQDRDFGDPIKVTMDSSCSYLVCSYSNRLICLFDFLTGEMVAQAEGHGEVITGVIFLPDCKHLISVGGDGCIFVWILPAPLSSKMLQRMKEISHPLSSACIMLPQAPSQIRFYEEDDHRSKENAVLDNAQVIQRMLSRDPQETPTFHFSISRLPKWAQAKVSMPDSASAKHDSSSSQVFSPAISSGLGYTVEQTEIETRSKGDLEGIKLFPDCMPMGSLDVDNSKGARMPFETQSFALDKRWLTIHTVCLDLLNSPGSCNVKGKKMPNALANLSSDPGEEKPSTSKRIKLSSKESGVDFDHDDGQDATIKGCSSLKSYGSLCHNTEINDSSICQQEVVQVTQKLQSQTSQSVVQATMEINPSKLNPEESDLFDQNFRNLSAEVNMDTRESSVRRSYSGRFVLQKDVLRDQSKVSSIPIQALGGEAICRGQVSDHDVALEEPCKAVLGELQSMSSCKQDESCITYYSDSAGSLAATVKSINTGKIKVGDRDGCNKEEIKKQKTVIACKEALLSLDAAAESTLQLFSKLGSLASREQIRGGFEAQLHAEAADILPSIAKKVHSLAKLVHFTGNSDMETAVDLSKFEPLLGTIAESLLQRVVEILKKSCNHV